MFLLVKKNKDNEWEIQKVITNVINVRGSVRDVTYGDISKLDLETQKLEGFWQQEDLYEGTGEYQIFSHKVVEFDEAAAIVRNTYFYVQMPIEDIRGDFKQRTKSLRDEKLNRDGVSTKDGEVVLPTDAVSRSNYSLLAATILISAESVKEPIIFETVEGVEVALSVEEFKEMVVQIALNTNSLYAKCREIISLIDIASTLEEVKEAASWD